MYMITMYINNNIFNFKNKKLILILNKIYGINIEQAKYILKNLGINTNISINDLTQTMLKQINNFLNKNYIINKDLQYKINNNIKSKTLINTYRGFRLKNKLPSHGQNTHSNGKTAKKINYATIKKYIRSFSYLSVRGLEPRIHRLKVGCFIQLSYALLLFDFEQIRTVDMENHFGFTVQRFRPTELRNHFINLTKN